MSKIKKIENQFVEHIPKDLKEGVVYVSLSFNTIVHKCLCGCGNEVVTPLSPTDWKLTYDGDSISLYPSIGNWSFCCRSHYWITNNNVEWSHGWSQKEISDGKKEDRKRKEDYFSKNKKTSSTWRVFKDLL